MTKKPASTQIVYDLDDNRIVHWPRGHIRNLTTVEIEVVLRLDEKLRIVGHPGAVRAVQHLKVWGYIAKGVQSDRWRLTAKGLRLKKQLLREGKTRSGR